MGEVDRLEAPEFWENASLLGRGFPARVTVGDEAV